MACVRYVELNPVRAGLVAQAQDWPWSSAAAHLAGRDDLLAQVAPLRDRVDDWPAFMAQGLDDDTRNAIRRGERTGRPLGSDAFIAALEARTGRTMARQRPGPKPAANAAR